MCALFSTESTWEMPVHYGYSVAFVDKDTGRRFWQHQETGETTWYASFDVSSLDLCVSLDFYASSLVFRFRFRRRVCYYFDGCLFLVFDYIARSLSGARSSSLFDF